MTTQTEVRQSPLSVAGEWWNGMSRPERLALLGKIRKAADLPSPNWRFSFEELAEMSFGDLPSGISLVILGTVQYKHEPSQLTLFLTPEASASVN